LLAIAKKQAGATVGADGRDKLRVARLEHANHGIKGGQRLALAGNHPLGGFDLPRQARPLPM